MLVRINKKIKIGTKVLLNNKEWATVKSIHETRKWIITNEFVGSFQGGHIIQFTNKE